MYTYITKVTVTECADRGLTNVRGRGRCGWRTPLNTAADRREARRYDDGGHMPFLGGIARRPAVTRHHVTTTACPTARTYDTISLVSPLDRSVGTVIAFVSVTNVTTRHAQEAYCSTDDRGPITTTRTNGGGHRRHGQP